MLVVKTESMVKAPKSGLDTLSEAIYQSNFIRKHFDFYQWQQQYVNKFIPHNVLIAAWGDFDKGELQFDVCSSIQEIHSEQFSGGCEELAPMMTKFYQQWQENDDKWIFQEEFKLWEMGVEFAESSKLLTEMLAMRTVLIYGFRDKRTNTTVIYAFLNSHLMYETQTSALSSIMPHLDAALRRVDCLPANKGSTTVGSLALSIISEREASVLKLVVEGKTNAAIAEDLFISVNTVKNHLKNIFKKMKVKSRAQAVVKFLDTTNIHQELQAASNVHKFPVA